MAKLKKKPVADKATPVSIEKTQVVVDHLQNHFNLKDRNFVLAGYADKGNKIITTLSNEDYDVQVTIKSGELLYDLECLANYNDEQNTKEETEDDSE